jgi:hypothetical protein
MDPNVFSDNENDVLTYTTTLLPPWLTFNSVTREFIAYPYLPAQLGPILITISVKDPYNVELAMTNFNIDVTNQNPTLVNLIPDQSFDQFGLPFSYIIPSNTFNDLDPIPVKFKTLNPTLNDPHSNGDPLTY